MKSSDRRGGFSYTRNQERGCAVNEIGVEVLHGPNGMTTRWETVTPEMATEWLEGAAKNRTLKAVNLSRLSAEIGGGFYHPHHQGIAFNTRGQLVDGRHRCTTIAKSGVSCQLMVTRNVPIEAVQKIDSGSARSVVDHLKIAGHDGISKSDVGEIRVALLGHPMTEKAKCSQITVEQVLSLTEMWKPFFAVTAPLSKLKIIGNRITRGVILRAAVSTKRTERLSTLVAILQSGHIVSENDSAGSLLRDSWLMSRIRHAGIGDSDIAYAKCESAVASFLQGMSLKKLYAAERELFPIEPVDVPDNCKHFVE